MPRFRFDGRDSSGARQEGEVDGASAEAAFERLERRGLTVDALQEIVRPASAEGRGRDLSNEDVADFSRQIAGLTRSGLPLHSALRALGDEIPSSNLRRVFSDVSKSLERGQTLEEAIASGSRRFPAHVRGLVIAGTRTGRLGEVLSEFSEYDQSSNELKRELMLSLSYPVLLLIAAASLFIILSQFVVLDFAKIFSDFGIDLPFMTIGLIRIATAMSKLGVWTVVGPLIAFAVFWLVERLALGPAQRRRIAFELPLFGLLWKWSSIAEFSHLLAVLIESEVPLSEALGLAAEGARDPALASASRHITADLESGLPFREALRHRTEFPRGYAKIMGWAEAHGSLPEALHMVGEIYDARARTQASFLGAVLSIATIVFVIFGIAFVYLALFLPLYKLITVLSG